MMRLTTLALALLVLAGAAAADWPQFQGSNRDGTSPEKGLLRAWPEGGPKVLWTVPLGQGFGAAAIRDGKVYVLDRIDDAKDVLRCLDLGTGKEEWTFAYDSSGSVSHNGSRSVPTVTDKYIFTVGVFGQVHCIDKATHKAVWTKHLLEDYGGKLPNWAITQSACLYGDAVILAPQSDTVGLVALEQATGKEKWRSGPIGAAAYASPLIVTLDGVDQAVLTTVEGASGVDAKTGEVLWTYPHKCEIPVPGPVAIGDGRFFITGGYDIDSDIIKVARSGGKFQAERLHRFEKIGAHVHQPILYKGYLYALCNTNSKADGLVCFSLDGQIKWQTKRAPYLCKGGYILTGDNLFYSMDGATGDLRIIEPSPDGYKEIAIAKGILSGKEIWAPLALSDGKLVVRDQRQMKCLDVKGP